MTPTELNAEYKRRFHEITAKLGRVCVPSDKEFWELSEWFKGEWKVGGPETAPEYQLSGALADAWKVPAPQARVTAGSSSPAANQVERAGEDHSLCGSDCSGSFVGAEDDRALRQYRALGAPGAGQNEREAASSPKGPSAQRGAAGGLLRVCVLCGQGWESPNARGRPSSICQTCRDGRNK